MALKRRYGQLSRLLVSYDLSFFVLVLAALLDEDIPLESARCVVQAFRDKPIAAEHALLDFAADLSVLLFAQKYQDDRQDGELNWRRRAFGQLLAQARRKAQLAQVSLHAQLAEKCSAIQSLEANAKKQQGCFEGQTCGKNVSSVDSMTLAQPGELAAQLFGEALWLAAEQARERFVIRAFNREEAQAWKTGWVALGAWIYLIDALDDEAKDQQHQRYNALPYLSKTAFHQPEERARQQEIAEDLHHQAKEAWPWRSLDSVQAYQILVLLEHRMSQAFSTLPYRRYESLIANIIQLGLADVRERVMARQSLPKT